MREDFLPVNRADMEKLHIEQLDYNYFSRDASLARRSSAGCCRIMDIR